MKIIAWGVFALIAVLWTSGAVLLAQLAQWSAQALAGVGGVSTGATAAIAVPPWLAPWIDTATWTAWQHALGAALSSLSALLPSLGDVAGWLIPLIWIAWGVGLIVLLGLTLTGIWMIHRVKSTTPIRPKSV